MTKIKQIDLEAADKYATDCAYETAKAFAEYREAAMIEGARLALHHSAGVAGQYSADAWDAIMNLDPAQIIKEVGDE